MNSLKKKSKKIKNKRDKKNKKGKKRKRRSSSSSSDASTSSNDSLTSSSSSSFEKHKHKKRKHSKDKRKKCKKFKEAPQTTGESSRLQKAVADKSDDDFSIPIDLMHKHKAPETREEYEKRQSILRRVVDEETGRTRLIKGDGEVIEEMVSKDRHREINKLATQTDGQVYQNRTFGQAAKK